MKVRLRALKRIGRLAPGDVFHKTRSDANILVALKVAELAPDTATVNEEEAPSPRRRTYRRRDIVAEGSEE